jgi:hypothetical protein
MAGRIARVQPVTGQQRDQGGQRPRPLSVGLRRAEQAFGGAAANEAEYRARLAVVQDVAAQEPGHGVAYSDAVQYGHATPSRVVRPVAYLIDGYQRVFYTYGPLFGLILLTGLDGVLRPRLRRRRLPRLSWSPRAGSMLPWATAVVLLVFPIAVADFDYRYLLPVLPFACLAAGLAFAPARVPPRPEPVPEPRDNLTSQVPGQVG